MLTIIFCIQTIIYHVITIRVRFTELDVVQKKDEDSLVAFAGENWNQAVIPPEMEKYPRSFSVTHYKNDENG